MKMTFGIFVALFGIAASGLGEMRTWTGKTGQTLEAEYVKEVMGKVVLRTSDGKEKSVAVSALSQTDQDYINLKHAPELEIKVKNNLDGKADEGDVDNVIETLRFEIEISKKSKRAYPGALKMHLFVVGWHLKDEEYVMAYRDVRSFNLTQEQDNKYSFAMKNELRLKHDAVAPVWGVKYKDYLVCITDNDGKVIKFKGSSKLKKHLHRLMKARTQDRFDKDFRPL